MNLISNARLMSGEIVDIEIADGAIRAIRPSIGHLAGESVGERIDAQGRLTLPAFVNGQLHACKSFWRRKIAALPSEQQSLPTFELAKAVKQTYSVDDVFARVDETMRLALQNGTCGIRLFADVDDDNGLNALHALLKIREKYSRWMTVQVVAFPQDGVFGAHTQSLMQQAMQLNPDVVGGIAFIEKGTAAQQAHVEMCFALARQYDKDLHFVADDVADPDRRTLEMIARATIDNGWHGRVACTQCAALSFYPDDYAVQVIALVKEAGITIYSNSHVSLIATEFDTAKYPWTRNTTRLRQLLDAGVPLVCGQDDIDNWFYPFGRNDMLEVAQFMAHQGQFAWRGEVDRVLPMVTSTPAQVLRMNNYGLHVGAPANLVVLDCPDWYSAIQFQPAKSYVILRGELVVSSWRVVEWGYEMTSLSG